jgi:flagellar basal-body rod modification protein FlgD
MSVAGVSGSTATTTANSTTATGLDKDDFLKLLVTQLQYQNPLDPMDPTEMMTQMTQLTQVEKLNNISDTLDAMHASSSKADQIGWLSVVGKKACVGSSTLSKGDQVVITPSGSYDKVTLTLKGADGNTKEVSFNAGDSLTYAYDGDSTVTASVSATYAGKATSCSLKVYNTIAGVELGDTSTAVVLANGYAYSTNQITGIRD